MKLLILGGTRFLGLHLVAAARAQGHEVTLFHRGKHGRAPVADVETIHGDRNTDLGRLRGRGWDAAIDTSGYLPSSVGASARELAAERYVYISSVSVYRDFSAPRTDESAPLAELTREQLEAASTIDASGPVSAVTYGRSYGGLKAACERAAEDARPGGVLTVRPGVIVGPHDYTDRLAYWVRRVARGGEVLAPGRPQRYVQFIDARDLTEWIVAMIERRESGIYNATRPPETMETLLQVCREVSGSDARFTWVDEAFLLARGVVPWSELPLWLPEEAAPQMRGFMAVDSRKAVDAGLRSRPLQEIVESTLRADEGRALRAGLTAEREQELLREYRCHSEPP